MMGKREFSVKDAARIRQLLLRKAWADRAEQKVVRASMRRLGFYISDFTSSTEGFTASDFDTLVEQGRIIVDGSSRPIRMKPMPRPIVPETIAARPSSPDRRAPTTVVGDEDRFGVIDFRSQQGISSLGFRGFVPVVHLQATGCAEVPKERGVYLVLRDAKESPVFLKRSVGGFFKGVDPTVPVRTLQQQWVDDAIVLNIGKAGGGVASATLKSRLKQYMDFGAGRPVGHKGGRYIWQLAGWNWLQVCWLPAPDEDPRSVERRLLQAFKAQYGKRPFANLQD